jgi:hypothetical protein
MKLLSKDAILKADDLPRQVVEVPEWGGSVMVRGLTGSERDKFEASVLVKKGKDYDVKLTDLRARLVVLSVIDEAGNRLFDDNDVAELGKKSASALNRVFEAAQRLSGLTDQDIEELEKNLLPALNGDLPSG